MYFLNYHESLVNFLTCNMLFLKNVTISKTLILLTSVKHVKRSGIPFIQTVISGLNPQEIIKVREAIRNATSLQEVERLTRMLHSGQIPGQKPLQPQTQSNGNRKTLCYEKLILLYEQILMLSRST